MEHNPIDVYSEAPLCSVMIAPMKVGIGLNITASLKAQDYFLSSTHIELFLTIIAISLVKQIKLLTN